MAEPGLRQRFAKPPYRLKRYRGFKSPPLRFIRDPDFWNKKSGSFFIKFIGNFIKMKTSEHWIKKLKLKKHPEGGYYREIYRSAENVSTPRGKRSESTAIYFLLKYPDVSHFHKIASDEVWHFYAGSELTVYMLDPKTKKLRKRIVGPECFSAVVPAGAWFGASVNRPGSYALVGCTVAPGFDFKDFELASKTSLLRQFPRYKNLIEKLSAH